MRCVTCRYRSSLHRRICRKSHKSLKTKRAVLFTPTLTLSHLSDKDRYLFLHRLRSIIMPFWWSSPANDANNVAEDENESYSTNGPIGLSILADPTAAIVE